MEKNEMLAAEKTALVVIDLQKGITGMPTAPYDAAGVVGRAADLVRAFHAKDALVVFVRVSSAADGKDMLHPMTDDPGWKGGERPADWSELVAELPQQSRDLLITKRQWGAFYGTELDLELRRRGMHTIVLCGIATNYGVESTARDAYERAYDIVFAEDAMSSRSAEDHRFAVERIFPRIGRVRSVERIVDMLR